MPGPKEVVLVVDGDPIVGTELVVALAKIAVEAHLVRSAQEALAALDSGLTRLVVTALDLPGTNGLALLAALSEQHPGLPVIVTSGGGSAKRAVEAMKLGAADFLAQPFDQDEISFVVGKVLTASARSDSEEAPARARTLIGESRAMQEVDTLIGKAAASTATVLIRGESGTGKEVAARSIHDRSPRRNMPFAKIQCAALPDSLLESELFGYEKGAFTGATTRKPGRVELAQGGTLLLDEIGDVTPATQVKLLRLLQDREFERLGSTKTLRIDVRFVAATHRDLDGMIKRGKFREDLFYRLAVIPVWLPPLRTRREDIAALARHFCRVFAEANDRPNLRMTDEALKLLRRQRWPGNVRQLQNFVERLVVLGDGNAVDVTDIVREQSRQSTFVTQPDSRTGEPSPRGVLEREKRDAERRALVLALDRARGNRTVAARVLGVSRRTLYNLLEEHGVP